MRVSEVPLKYNKLDKILAILYSITILFHACPRLWSTSTLINSLNVLFAMKSCSEPEGVSRTAGRTACFTSCRHIDWWWRSDLWAGVKGQAPTECHLPPPNTIWSTNNKPELHLWFYLIHILCRDGLCFPYMIFCWRNISEKKCYL